MLKKMRSAYRAWRDYFAFSALKSETKNLVFYSEGFSNFIHFDQVLRALTTKYDYPIIYVTSDLAEKDAIGIHKNIRAYYIGYGPARTLFFATLKCKILVMTMPDLQTFHIKRSTHPVHYTYIQHSLVSSHMIYRPAAFDHFDTVFCAGPHHELEIRAREQNLNLKRKNLVAHGYGRLDTLLAETDPNRNTSQKEISSPITVLIAPSWGKTGLLEKHGGHYIKHLLELNFRVILRPHPQTILHNASLLDSIRSSYSTHAGFTYEGDVTKMSSLKQADIMISDWSGVALEFAFSRLRPVLFIDTPRKINNDQYLLLKIEPIEVGIREVIGTLLPETRLDEIGYKVRELLESASFYREKIKAVREQYVFNLGKSGLIGADALMELLQKISVDDTTH